MDDKTIQFFKERLSALFTALTEDGAVKIKPNRQTPSEKTDDDHQPLNEMLQSIASSRNRNHALVKAEIAEALDTIERYPDEYGICIECEKPIAHRRLLMMPYTQMCVQCKEASEGNKTSRRRHLTDYS